MRSIQSPFLAAFALSALVLVDWGTSPSSAHAQAGHIQGAVRLDVHLGVGWRGSLGPGMRVDIPIARDGLISSVNDELALTLGADFLFHTYEYDSRHHYYQHQRDGDLTLLFPIAMQWNFILNSRWTVFPELGLAIESHDHHYEHGYHDRHVHVLPNIGAGARWHFNSGQAALLLRLTHPGTFQVGITW